MNPGPTDLVDMPNGSVACFQLEDLGADEVEDLDLEVDPVLVDPELDLSESTEEDVEDWTDRMESALVEIDASSFSIGLLGCLSASMAGTMVAGLCASVLLFYENFLQE